MSPDLSLEQITAGLSEDEQFEVLSGFSAQELEDLPYNWAWTGRPSQQIPVLPGDGGNDWDTGLVMAGRGNGKTRTGCEWIKAVDEHWPKLGRVQGSQRLRVALVGRTAADVRDTLIQGESGLANIYPPSLRDFVKYTPSRRRLDLPGGGMVICFSAEEPDQLRGPQFHCGYADELAAHKQITGADDLTAWDNLKFAVRLGSVPQILATTTPKRVKVIKTLLKQIENNPRSFLRRGRTADNVHLDKVWLQNLLNTYEGTEKGKQELEGEMLEVVAGALTTEDQILLTRVTELPGPLGSYFRFVGLDPSVSEKKRDEAGVVVVYVDKLHPVSARHAYVVDDQSGQYTPDEWAEKAVLLAHKHKATIIPEVNQGGALVKNSLMQVAKDFGIVCPPIRETWSSKAKAVRAEPVGVAYARGRVHMVGEHDLLESELTSWTPEDPESPNRLDAMVFGVVAGIFDNALVQGSPGSAKVQTVTNRTIASSRQITRPVIRTQVRASQRNGFRYG